MHNWCRHVPHTQALVRGCHSCIRRLMPLPATQPRATCGCSAMPLSPRMRLWAPTCESAAEMGSELGWHKKRSAFPALTALSVPSLQVCVWQDHPRLCSQDQHNTYRQAELHLLQPEALGPGLCIGQFTADRGEQRASARCQPRMWIPQSGSHPLTTNSYALVLFTLHPMNARDCTARQLALHSFTSGASGAGRAAHRTPVLPQNSFAP